MLLNRELPGDVIAEKQYAAGYTLFDQMYRSKDYVASGAAVDETELCSRIFDRFNDTFYNVYSDESSDTAALQTARTVYPAAEGDKTALTDEQINKLVSIAAQNDFSEYPENYANFRSWLSYNRGVYAVYRQDIIDEQLSDLSVNTRWSQEVLRDFDYYAYSKQTDTTLTSRSDIKDAADASKLLNESNYPLVCSLNTDKQWQWSGTLYRQNENEGDWYLYDTTIDESSLDFTDSVLIIALKPDTLSSLQTEWTTVSTQFQQTALFVSIAALLFLLCLIVLICGAGRTADNQTAHLIAFDAVWTEAQIIGGGLGFFAWFGWIAFLIQGYTSIPSNVMSPSMALLSALLAAVLLALLLSQVRRLKTHTWLDGFLLLRLIRRYVIRAWRWLCGQFRKTPLRKRVILAAVLVPLAGAVWPLLPFAIAAVLYFGLREADRFESVAAGASDIRTGKHDTHIQIDGGSKELTALADDLNGISDGLSNAVATAVKSERLKSELISNVSHDIKTPLTSIITYIDLLKKCDLTDPTAREYVEVLDQKAQRLRTLTGDLFDASKATSGAMKVELMQTDFDALLRQALGERAEHLEKAGLDVRIDSKPPVYVNADGRLLWRILDNLISNCARYAVPNSRVYIAIRPEGDFVTLTMKNISAHELNISSDELMQRFTRGDRSRHTEGSGLGLSIAKSLAELMHGTCRVEIDGDLFKAIVTIPRWNNA